MKLCMLSPGTKQVRILRPPRWSILDFRELTSDFVEVQVDTLTMELRELNGVTCMVAYDRTTDTLYITEPDREELW
jgi:hypothetical protein